MIVRIVKPDEDNYLARIDASSTDGDSKHGAYTFTPASELSNEESDHGTYSRPDIDSESPGRTPYFPHHKQDQKRYDDRPAPRIEEPDSDLVVSISSKF